jgi:type IV fimbrial biogenesis protein FimT
MAIVSTLAMPGMNDLVKNSERTSAVNTFIHALFFARSEAMTRGGVVSLCKSMNGSSCMNRHPDWNAGWMVFANTDRDDPPVRDADEEVLAVYPGWQGGHITSNRQAYSFRPYLQGVVNGTILFCDPRGGSEARAIVISHTGRPRVSQRASGNKPLRCPAR